MTPQERDERAGLEAVAQLTKLCESKNAHQLAEIEAQLTIMGFSKLAGIVFAYGIGNAGDDYIDLRHNALQAKF